MYKHWLIVGLACTFATTERNSHMDNRLFVVCAIPGFLVDMQSTFTNRKNYAVCR